MRSHWKSSSRFFAGASAVCFLTNTAAFSVSPFSFQKPIDEPLFSLKESQTASFDTSFTALAQKSGVIFFTEGHPYKETLSANELPKIPVEGLPLNEMVQRLAAAYDYEAHRQGGFFLLQKRYTYSDDVPNVTLGECAASASVIGRLLAPYDANMNAAVPRDKDVRDLLSSFTPEQSALMKQELGKVDPTLARMRDRALNNPSVSPEMKQRLSKLGQSSMVSSTHPLNTALPVSSLSPQQQRTVQRFALYFYTGKPVLETARAYADMAWLAQNEVSFRKEETHGLYVLGYESPQAPRPFGLIPLSHPQSVRMENEGLITQTTRLQTADPTDPDRFLIAQQAQRLGNEATLQSEVFRLTRETGDTTTVHLDKVVADKPLRVFGNPKAETTQTMLRAMGDLYGLRVTSGSDGSLTLTTRPFRAAPDVLALRSAIVSALPFPIARSLHLSTGATGVVETNLAVFSGRITQTATEPVAKAEAPSLSTRQAQSVRIACVRLLRAQVDPKLEQATTAAAKNNRQNAKVSLSACSPHAFRAFSAAVMMAYLQNLGDFFDRPVPPTVAHNDQLQLVGGPCEIQGLPFYAFFVCAPSDDGKKLTTGPGFYVRVRPPAPANTPNTP